MDLTSLFGAPTGQLQGGGLLGNSGAAAMQLLGAGAPRMLPGGAPQPGGYGYGGGMRQPQMPSADVIAYLRQKLGMPPIASPFGAAPQPPGLSLSSLMGR